MILSLVVRPISLVVMSNNNKMIKSRKPSRPSIGDPAAAYWIQKAQQAITPTKNSYVFSPMGNYQAFGGMGGIGGMGGCSGGVCVPCGGGGSFSNERSRGSGCPF